MARKTKGDKGITGDTGGTDDSTIILDYLREQKSDMNVYYRPYSAIEISANLHNKVSKAQAAKLLRELQQNGDIEGRTAGKQVVYHALQDASQSVTPEDIATRKRDVEKLQDELATIKAKEKQTRAALSTFEGKPRLSDIRQDIQRLEEERSAIQARLTSHHGDDAVNLPPEEREKLEQEWKQWQRYAIGRRRICRELWGKCTEVLPEKMTSQELWETLGLEGTIQ